MKIDEMVIGIVGGMGSYATVDFFRRLVDAFPAKKEWDRPHIIIDNFCSMPSRVRAVLYDENKEKLIEDLSSSVSNLLRAGANHIILACNTSHIFIPDIIDKVPESQGKIVHIIEECAKKIPKYENVFLLATEGTIESGIYESLFENYGIKVTSPIKEQYLLLREFIEAIKQNNISENIKNKFKEFVESSDNYIVVLGCTELPILYSECLKNGYKSSKKIIDPLQCVIDKLVSEIKS